jgi:nuclear protein localization protein 4 homolog
LKEFAFTVQRCGYLIGITKKVDRPQRFQKGENGKDEEVVPSDRELKSTFEEVEVYAIYEPPQAGDEVGFQEYEDEIEEKVNMICASLGMKRVGYIFSHARGQTQEKHVLTPEEIIRAGKMQSKYGDSFVSIAVYYDAQSGHPSFEAFQAAQQCAELASKDLLSVDPKNDKIIKTKKPVTIVGTSLEKNEIDIEFLYSFNTPMKKLDGPFRSGFPPRNRKNEQQSYQRLKNVLVNRKNQGLNFVKRITDFHLLVFLTEFLDMKTDMPTLCEAIRTQNNSMAGGFEYLINSYAGIE